MKLITLPILCIHADNKVKQLLDASVEIRKQSYSPYSHFKVGAAVRGADGKIYLGCNVENASFGLTICAERTALVKAVSNGCLKFDEISIAAVNKDQFTSPCGACRQFLAEFNPRIKIYLCNPDIETVAETTLSHLLPESFNPENVEFS